MGWDRQVMLERAYKICRFATWHRDQMEGELAELCQIFGVNIDQDCLIRDWCIEVIYDGLSLDVLVDRVTNLRKQEREAQS
jgi:hypothetical protein